LGLDDEPMWQDPIVGFGRGDDPYFEFLREDIGGFHWSPAEAFRLGRAGVDAKDADLCVVSIAFPQTVKTKGLNAKCVGEPTPRWTLTRGEWEGMMSGVSRKIVDALEARGVRAVSIEHIKEFKRETSEKYGVSSNWSHRHVAFICGLGTFGLSDGLITRKGKAMRFTTILIEADTPADVRGYEKYNEWCRFRDGCRGCIKRCPVGAISEQGHDKKRCSDFLAVLKERGVQEGLLRPEQTSGCGLCQCGVPCQDGIPQG
jgi:epoxyqueuosine reductase QueG